MGHTDASCTLNMFIHVQNSKNESLIEEEQYKYVNI